MRDVGSHQELEEARDRVFPGASRGTSPADAGVGDRHNTVSKGDKFLPHGALSGGEDR